MKFKNFFLVKLIICFILSFLIYLSFRFHLIHENNIRILISFLLVEAGIWSIVFFPKKKYFSIASYNIFFLIILNLLLTPLFYTITFDVPIRKPNYEITKKYDGDFFKGMFSGTHFISVDEKGYRTNKKINYEKKTKETVRIFSIGASTTEQGETDNKKTWSSLLATNLSKLSNKNVEVINAGMAGLRAKHHFITLKRIKKYEPNLVIFLLGINDWNYHIINSEKKYSIPSYEIKFSYKKSILFKFFGNINKQINRKIFVQKELDDSININNLSAEFDTESYLKPQINSLEIRSEIRNFRPKNVSQEYAYWVNLIIKECKKEKLFCLFLDQPTAYQTSIEKKLKKRLWMTPPNQEYTLNLNDLIFISSFYNEWLRNKIMKNKLNFLLLSDKMEANTQDLFDDCHFTENGSKKVSDFLANYISLNLKSILN